MTRLVRPGSISALLARARTPGPLSRSVRVMRSVLLSSPSGGQALRQFASSERVIRELFGANTSEGLPVSLKRLGRPSMWTSKPGAFRRALPDRSIQFTLPFSQRLLPTSPIYGTATTGINPSEDNGYFRSCSIAAATGAAAPEGLDSTTKQCAPARTRTPPNFLLRETLETSYPTSWARSSENR
jgi:hypothetical protein